jgi:hypothetical protein
VLPVSVTVRFSPAFLGQKGAWFTFLLDNPPTVGHCLDAMLSKHRIAPERYPVNQGALTNLACVLVNRRDPQTDVFAHPLKDGDEVLVIHVTESCC